MNNTAKVLMAIGAGIAVGAAIGVLYAPEEGRETRKKIMKRSKKLIGTVHDSIANSKESLGEIRNVLQKQLQKVNRRIEDTI